VSTLIFAARILARRCKEGNSWRQGSRQLGQN